MIPIDNFSARANSSTITWLLRSAVLAHQNVLRVWGGGAYETDEFYDVRYRIESVAKLDKLIDLFPRECSALRRDRHPSVVRKCHGLWCLSDRTQTYS